MATFETKWKSGKTEIVEQSDCATVEQYVNCRFGRGVDLEAFGVEITLVGAPVEEVEEKKAPETPVAKAWAATHKKAKAS